MYRAIIGLALFLGGGACAQTPPPAKHWPTATAPAMTVLIDKCPLTNRGACTESLLAAAAGEIGLTVLSDVVKAGVTRGLDAISKYLDSIASDYGATSTAIGGGPLLTPPDQVRAGCLIFARGRITTASTAPDLAKITDAFWADKVKSVNAAIRNDAIVTPRLLTPQLTDTPEIYAEFQVSYRAFAQVIGEKPVVAQFTLQPLLVWFGKSAAKRGPTDDKNLLFQITLTTLTPGTPTPTTLLAQVFDLGLLKAGGAACLSQAVPEILRSRIACTREILREPQFVALNGLGRATIPSTGADGKPAPVTVHDPVHIRAEVTLTEAQDAGDLTTALAAILRQEDVAKSISTQGIDLLKALLAPPATPPK